MIENLTDKNINAYIIASYSNPQCLDMEEFDDDIKRIKYIKRLINRYTSTGELKHRLILNHIISFYNVFDHVAATRILFFKIDSCNHFILKTFLVYLALMPKHIDMIRGKNILNSDVLISEEIANQLRNL